MRRDLLQKGYGLVRCVQVEGIPNLFAERVMRTVTGTVAAAPATYTMSYALAVRDGVTTQQDCDRKAGFAAASDKTITLGRQELVDEGLTAALFAKPTMRATLTTTVSDPATTTFVVDDASGFPSPGSFYIGRERCAYSGTTGTSFTSITRGVNGFTHYHSANSVSGFREVTDTPIYWVGRFVTIWVHVVSPEGRYLGTDWCTLGDYCWQEWRGYIAEQPVPTTAGMELRCSALVRLAGGKVGATIKGPSAMDSSGMPLVYYTPTDALKVYEVGGGLDVTGSPLRTGVGTLADWCAIVGTNLNAVAGSDDVVVRPNGERVRVDVRLAGTTNAEVAIQSPAWFLTNSEESAATTSGFVRNHLAFKPTAADWGLVIIGWVVVELEPSADYTPASVPSSGMLVMEVDGVIEVAEYDGIDTGWNGRFTAFRLLRRGVGGTRVNPWATGATIGVVSGVPDSNLPITLFSLWQSSGQTGGPRGAYDDLAFGFGLGIPDDYIDEAAWVGYVFTSLDLVVADEIDIAESIGGHLALRRSCVVQRLMDTGEIKLSLVSTDIIDDPSATEIAKGDLLLDGVQDVEQLEAPNHIRIDTGYPGRDGITIVVRDSARAAAQGKVDWDIAAPGLPDYLALDYGASLLPLTDGQQAAKLSLPPWSTVQEGDAVELTAAHPQVYSWTSAEWGPASITGRVIGAARSDYDDTLKATVLLEGQYSGPLYLCPSAEVTAAPSASVLRMSKGSVGRFQAGDEVAVYLPGSEDTDYEEVGITSIDTTNPSYDVLNLDASLSVVTPAAGLIVTFPVYANANTRQRRYLYVRSDRAWR